MQSKSKIDGGNQGEEFGPDAFTFDELDRMVRRKTQREDRNFLSLRVFSNKFQDEIKHTTIEKHALEGTRVLAPRMYTVYLPRVSGGQKLITEEAKLESSAEAPKAEASLGPVGVDTTPGSLTGSRLR